MLATGDFVPTIGDFEKNARVMNVIIFVMKKERQGPGLIIQAELAQAYG
jgi:hypothetical protein